MILYHKWIELPIGVRHQIAKDFGIEKKGATEVDSNYIKSDGYFVRDIETALTIESMMKFLSTEETDIAILFDMLTNHYTNPVVKVENEIIKPKRTRTNAKKD